MYLSEILVLFACLKKGLFLSMCMDMCLWMWMLTEALCPLELALQGFVSHPTWVLEIELRSSRRAVWELFNYWTISSLLFMCLFLDRVLALNSNPASASWMQGLQVWASTPDIILVFQQLKSVPSLRLPGQNNMKSCYTASICSLGVLCFWGRGYMCFYLVIVS